MEKKSVWVVLSCLMIVALVLASCRPAAVEEEGERVAGRVVEKEVPVKKEVVVTEEKEMVRDSLGRLVEKPQYGGMIPVQISYSGDFDPVETSVYVTPAVLTYDSLVCEDWARGPSGTEETSLANDQTPLEYFTGWLAERWELPDLQTMIFYLRKGVHFHNKPPVNGRELTADDVVFTFNRNKENPKSGSYQTEDTVTKIDKYTVRFDMVEPNVEALRSGRAFIVIPHEVIEQYGDLRDWRTIVGTGPYMVVDFVPDSSTTLVRNPNYWQHDPLHPENRLPYIESLKALVIPDPSTMLSALRTGKLARLSFERAGLGQTHALSLMQTNPELRHKKMPPSRSYVISVRMDQEDKPWANKKVRQALMLALDNETITRDYYKGDAEILSWPYMYNAGAAYTPLEELPDELRELFEYHPDKAKQLLAEAGYPNGFKTGITVRPRSLEWVAIVKDYWDAIGVETELNVVERGAWLQQILAKNYTDMVATIWGNVDARSGLGAHICDQLFNYSVVCDERIDEAADTIMSTLDPSERSKIYKEIGLYIIEQQYWIQTPSPNTYVFWQPWLKGYNGEMFHGTALSFYGIYKFAWLDHELRESMK